MKKFVLCLAGIAAAAALTGCAASDGSENLNEGAFNNNATANSVTSNEAVDVPGSVPFSDLVEGVSGIGFLISPCSSHITNIEGSDVSKVLAYFNGISCVAVDFDEAKEEWAVSGAWDVMMLHIGCPSEEDGLSTIQLFKSGNFSINIGEQYYKSVRPIDYDGFVATMHKLVDSWR